MLETITEKPKSVQRASAQTVPVQNTAPVKLVSLLSAADKISIKERHLLAVSVYTESGAIKHVSLAALVDPRTEFVRDVNQRLSGYPAVTGG